MYTFALIMVILLCFIQFCKEFAAGVEERVAGKAILSYMAGAWWCFAIYYLIVIARYINGLGTL